MMIGFFTDPNPGELIFSACARFGERMRYPNIVSVAQELFGIKGASVLVDFPNRLEHLISVLPPGHKYTVDDIIDDHTLFPFYALFLPPERVQLLRKDMRGDDENHIRERLGIKAGRLSSPMYLRFCPTCVKEDRKRHGETYWHRNHQIAGIEVCSVHAVFLEITKTPWRDVRNPARLISAERSIHQISPRSLDLANTQDQILLKLARDASWLLKQRLQAPGIKALRDRYYNRLLEHGYAYYNGRIRTTKLVEDFIKYYSQELLEKIQCPIRNSNQCWLLRLLHPHRGSSAQNPLRHLLLITFLGYTAEQFFTSPQEFKPFGDGPWPCLNHASRHFGEMRITNCKIADDLGHKGRPLGMFRCQCGFIYTRTGPDTSVEDLFRKDSVMSYGNTWENFLRKNWNNLTITVQEIADKLSVSHLTVTRHAIRLQLPMNTLGARVVSINVIKRFKTSRKMLQESLKSYRSRWINIVQATPGATRNHLIVKNSYIYLWLRRNDSKWLEAHLPPPRKYVHRMYRLDWGNIDSELSAAIELATTRIRSLPGRPLRVSITALIKIVGHKSWIERYLDRLPATFQAIETHLELPEEFELRKVKWANEQYKQEGIHPTRSQFVKRASISPKAGSAPKVQSAINAVIEILARSSPG
jgi:hypothetical protein